MDNEELLDKAKELQKMFRQTESDEEDDLMNEFEQEFTNWMWNIENRDYKLLLYDISSARFGVWLGWFLR